jgi:hypothetical protein
MVYLTIFLPQIYFVCSLRTGRELHELFFYYFEICVIRVIRGKFYTFKSRSAALVNISSSLAKQKRMRFKSV